MNPRAKKWFAERPDAKYWYYSSSIRVPNPQLYRQPDWSSDPWPDEEELHLILFG